MIKTPKIGENERVMNDLMASMRGYEKMEEDDRNVEEWSERRIREEFDRQNEKAELQAYYDEMNRWIQEMRIEYNMKPVFEEENWYDDC